MSSSCTHEEARDATTDIAITKRFLCFIRAIKHRQQREGGAAKKKPETLLSSHKHANCI